MHNYIYIEIALLIFSAGFFFYSFFFNLFMYLKWQKKINLTLSIMLCITILIIPLDVFSLFFRKIIIDYSLSIIFFKISKLLILLYIPLVLMLLKNLSKQKPFFLRINRVIGVSLLILIAATTILSVFFQKFFISLNDNNSFNILYGFIYPVNMIINAVVSIYCLISILVNFSIKSSKRFHFILIILSITSLTTAFIMNIIQIFFKRTLDNNLLLDINYIIIYTILLNGAISLNFLNKIQNLKKYYTKLKFSKKKWIKLAYFDSLTGLMNKKSFYKKLDESINELKLKKNDSTNALFFIDLDNLKYINDTVGYTYGDNILKEVAKRIKSIISDKDFLFRFGGDEFTIILKNLKDKNIPSSLSKLLIQELSKPFTIKGTQYFLGNSIGITYFPQDGDKAETLIKNAGTALNEAKKQKNTYRYYSKIMEQQAIEKVGLINDLKKAILNKEFLLYYQPILNLDEKFTGAEALLIWKHPQKGIIRPLKFIPAAEDSMLIVPIGEWVLRKALENYTELFEQGFINIFVSVNLSIQQVREKNFNKKINSILNNVYFNLNNLHLEITETFMMENINDNINKLKKVQEKGIKISIDDFGTGYSSLSYLQNLPIDSIKIDKSFITDIPKNKKSNPLVESIVIMANKLNKKVIIEGVETKEQLNYIKSLKSNVLIQGYYFAKPMPFEELKDFIDQHS